MGQSAQEILDALEAADHGPRSPGPDADWHYGRWLAFLRNYQPDEYPEPPVNPTACQAGSAGKVEVMMLRVSRLSCEVDNGWERWWVHDRDGQRIGPFDADRSRPRRRLAANEEAAERAVAERDRLGIKGYSAFHPADCPEIVDIGVSIGTGRNGRLYRRGIESLVAELRQVAKREVA